MKQNPERKELHKRLDGAPKRCTKSRRYGSRFLIILSVFLIVLAMGVTALFVSLFGKNMREEKLTGEQIDSAINLSEEDPDLLGESSTPLSGEVSADLVRKKGAYSFIIGGSSNGFINTDTLMLVYFEPAAGKLNIMQIPRDTYVISTGGKSKKINAAYAYGRGDGLKKTIASTFGIAVDNYVVISTEAFRDVVDAIGGVTVDVPIDMNYDDPAQNLSIHLKKGEQLLDGNKAEQFVRFRKGYANQDLGRMDAQKIFMSAFAKKMFSIDGITKIPAIINQVFKNIRTDMSVADMIGYATKCFDLDTSKIQFFALPGEGYKNGLYVSIYEKETLDLLNQHFNPYTRDLAKSDVHIKELSRKEADHYQSGGTTVDGVNKDEANPTDTNAATSGDQPDKEDSSKQVKVDVGNSQNIIYLRHCHKASEIEPLVKKLRALGFTVETRELALKFDKTVVYYSDKATQIEKLKSLLPKAEFQSEKQEKYLYEIYLGSNYQ